MPVRAAERLMPDEEILWQGSSRPSLFRMKSYYVLTNERLMIRTKVASYRKVANCPFGQVLAISYHRNLLGGYIRLVTPSREVPAKLRPAKKPREFYEALMTVWQREQVNADADETARAQQLYNPPMPNWIAYAVSSGAMRVLTFAGLALITRLLLRQSWDVVLLFSLWVSLYLPGIPLRTFFLGKDFTIMPRVAPLHNRLFWLIWLLWIVPLVVACLIWVR